MNTRERLDWLLKKVGGRLQLAYKLDVHPVTVNTWFTENPETRHEPSKLAIAAIERLYVELRKEDGKRGE